jgi:hypothetical protein
MISKQALNCLKEHNDNLKKLSIILDDMFINWSNAVYDVLISELKVFDNCTELSLSNQRKYITDYFIDIPQSITQQIMIRLQKEDKKCVKILNQSINEIPSELDNYTYNLIEQEILSVMQRINKSFLFIKEFYQNAKNTHSNRITELKKENKSIKMQITKNKYQEQINDLNIKYEALLSILRLYEPEKNELFYK